MGNTVIVTINQAKYGWTKYGGARQGLVKGEHEFWYCQCCKTKLTKEMPQYMFPIDKNLREYVRICNTCEHLVKVADIHSFSDLVIAIRKLD